MDCISRLTVIERRGNCAHYSALPSSYSIRLRNCVECISVLEAFTRRRDLMPSARLDKSPLYGAATPFLMSEPENAPAVCRRLETDIHLGCQSITRPNYRAILPITYWPPPRFPSFFFYLCMKIPAVLDTCRCIARVLVTSPPRTLNAIFSFGSP